MAFFGAAARVPHEIDRQLDSVRPGPDVRERFDAAGDLEHRERKAREIRVVEEAQREAFLGRALQRQPLIGHFAKRGQQRGHVARRHDADRRAVGLEPVVGEAHLLARAALERKRGERHQRFFARLGEREADVRVVVQVVLAHLIEHGHAVRIVDALEEAADQRSARRAAGRPDRGARPTCVRAAHTSGTPTGRRSKSVPCRRGTRGTASSTSASQ